MSIGGWHIKGILRKVTKIENVEHHPKKKKITLHCGHTILRWDADVPKKRARCLECAKRRP